MTKINQRILSKNPFELKEIKDAKDRVAFDAYMRKLVFKKNLPNLYNSESLQRRLMKGRCTNLNVKESFFNIEITTNFK